MNKKKEALAGWLFLAPALVVFLALVIIPIIMSFLLSFADWNFLSGLGGLNGAAWITLKNYLLLTENS